MPAYMIAEMDVTNAEDYEAYKAEAAAVITRYGGRYIVRGGDAVVLEGMPPKRVVVVEFDSIDAAQRWYRSSDYQKAKLLRANAAISRMYIMQSTPTDNARSTEMS